MAPNNDFVHGLCSFFMFLEMKAVCSPKTSEQIRTTLCINSKSRHHFKPQHDGSIEMTSSINVYGVRHSKVVHTSENVRHLKAIQTLITSDKAIQTLILSDRSTSNQNANNVREKGSKH